MTATTPTINPFLTNNFAPIKEETTADDLKVIGELPPDLSGMFVRNGPNPQFNPIGQYHWFDGDGMLHGVRIKDGKASYRNRYVRTYKFQVENQEGKAVWPGFLNPAQRDNPHGTDINTGNTALVYHANHFYALWEGGGGAPYHIKLPELETIGKQTFNSKLESPFTAHPKVDAVTGEMMFFGYSMTQPPFLQYGVVSANGELLRTIPIDLPLGVSMHDFAITENYSIFFDLPMTFRAERAEKGEFPVMFEPETPGRFGIIPRHGDSGEVHWFETPPCFVWHSLNAYEQGDEVVLLACRLKSVNVFMADDSDRFPDANIPYLYRWRFNLKTGAVKEEQLDDAPSEFPRVNEELLGRKTRYGYSARMEAGEFPPLFDALIKYDLDTGKSETYEFGKGRYGGEAVFAPRLNASSEDDGWLLTYVYDENTQTSELVVVNAQDVSGETVARVIIPQRVPYGFHAAWVTEAQLS
ncbi:MAG: carotenoid oxygenase family protein [Microcoleaceae cyanobacterium MO_207.B10]|nr:carotenoid oxygenase family protein [Microcoleaceae cyanobacterium MO_207.B10]